jgi:hypothetical protein
MLPLTLLAPEKLVSLLTTNSALQMAVNTIAAEAGVVLPPIANSQIVVTSISQDVADKNAQLTYPRVCLYSTQVKNTQMQKFRSFSGSVVLVAEVWFSGNLLAPTGTGLHYYVEALTSILRANQGGWSDGFYFSGLYDVQIQPPKAGGFGFVESARITCSLDVNIN